MKKSALSLILVFALAAIASAQSNLLKNPGFEDGDQFWKLGDKEGMATITPEAAKKGKNGLRIVDKSAEQGSGVISERFPVTPGQKVKLVFWAKTLDPKFISVCIVPFAQDKSWTTDGSEKLPAVALDDATGKWKKYELEFVAMDHMDAVAIWIHSWSSSQGTADFDDFDLRIK